MSIWEKSEVGGSLCSLLGGLVRKSGDEDQNFSLRLMTTGDSHAAREPRDGALVELAIYILITN